MRPRWNALPAGGTIVARTLQKQPVLAAIRRDTNRPETVLDNTFQH